MGEKREKNFHRHQKTLLLMWLLFALQTSVICAVNPDHPLITVTDFVEAFQIKSTDCKSSMLHGRCLLYSLYSSFLFWEGGGGEGDFFLSIFELFYIYPFIFCPSCSSFMLCMHYKWIVIILIIILIIIIIRFRALMLLPLCVCVYITICVEREREIM